MGVAVVEYGAAAAAGSRGQHGAAHAAVAVVMHGADGAEPTSFRPDDVSLTSCCAAPSLRSYPPLIVR